MSDHSGVAAVDARTGWAPEPYVAVVLTFVVCVALPESVRLAALPVLAVMFALAYIRRPLPGVVMLVVSVGLPVYFSVRGSDAGTFTVVLALVAWTIDLVRGRLVRLPAALPPVALILVPAFIAVGRLQGTSVGQNSLRMTLAFTSAFLLGHVIVSHTHGRRELMILLAALAGAVVLQSLIATAQGAGLSMGAVTRPFTTRQNLTDSVVNSDGSVRAGGLIRDYELLAEWCAAMFVVLVAVTAVGGRGRWFAAAGAIACAAGVVATASRAGIIAAAAGLFVFAFVVLARRRAVDLRVIAAVVLLVMAAVTFVAVVSPVQSDTLATRFGYTQTQLQSNAGGASLLNRDVWTNLPPEMTAWSPMGHGLFRMDLIGWWSLHSLWFTVRYQFGLVGTVGFVWLFCWVGFGLLRRASGAGDRAGGLLAAGLLAGLVAILASEIVVEFLRKEPTMAFMGAYLALGVAATRVLRPPASPNSV